MLKECPRRCITPTSARLLCRMSASLQPITPSRVSAADATASPASAPLPKDNIVKSAVQPACVSTTTGDGVVCCARAEATICNTYLQQGRAAKLRQTATLEFPAVRPPLLLCMRSQQRQLSIPAMSAVHKVLCRNTHRGACDLEDGAEGDSRTFEHEPKEMHMCDAHVVAGRDARLSALSVGSQHALRRLHEQHSSKFPRTTMNSSALKKRSQK